MTWPKNWHNLKFKTSKVQVFFKRFPNYDFANKKTSDTPALYIGIGTLIVIICCSFPFLCLCCCAGLLLTLLGLPICLGCGICVAARFYTLKFKKQKEAVFQKLLDGGSENSESEMKDNDIPPFDMSIFNLDFKDFKIAQELSLYFPFISFLQKKRFKNLQ